MNNQCAIIHIGIMPLLVMFPKFSCNHACNRIRNLGALRYRVHSVRAASLGGWKQSSSLSLSSVS